MKNSLPLYYRVEDLCRMFRIPESLIRRMFIARVAPPDWFWERHWSSPRWNALSTADWARTIAEVGRSKLPRDPGKWIHPGQTRGLGASKAELALIAELEAINQGKRRAATG